jgi:hypothetical protein
MHAEIDFTCMIKALPREQTYSWNEGMCLRCHSLQSVNDISHLDNQ